MFTKKSLKKVVSLVFIMLLAACGSKNDNLPTAALQARSFLAEQLNISEDKIDIIGIEKVEWTDSCFGLGGPAESCLAAITPGWQVFLDIDGQVYEVRLNEEATLVRSPQFP